MTTGLHPDDLLARRYRLLRFRGRGGAGEVWEAEDRVAHTRVALKVFLDGAAPPASFLARLRHPALVRHLDRLELPGLSALTMELADASLGAVLRGPSNVSSRELPARSLELVSTAPLALLRDIAAALAYLHSLTPPIAHGDLKPDNVLLFDATARLADVGAPAPGPAATSIGPVASSRAGATTAESPRMTLAYAAPERWTRATSPATPAADIYAFGVVAHELLAGARPFDGPIDVLDRLHRLTLPPPLPASIAPDLAALIARCLAKDPALRPLAPDLLAALARP